LILQKVSANFRLGDDILEKNWSVFLYRQQVHLPLQKLRLQSVEHLNFGIKAKSFSARFRISILYLIVIDFSNYKSNDKTQRQRETLSAGEIC